MAFKSDYHLKYASSTCNGISIKMMWKIVLRSLLSSYNWSAMCSSFYMAPPVVIYAVLQSHKILGNQHVLTWGMSSLSNYSGRHWEKLFAKILEHLILILFYKWSCVVDFIINNVRNVSSFLFIKYSTDKRQNEICVYKKRWYVISSYHSQKTFNYYILTYFNTVCTVHSTKINLHNQLYMHKICSFDIIKSQTHFGT